MVEVPRYKDKKSERLVFKKRIQGQDRTKTANTSTATGRTALTSDSSLGVIASEKTQCTPGKREPSSSHKFRAMHSFRSISSGLEPGALDVRVRKTAVVAGKGALLRAIMLSHGAALWPRIMIRVAARTLLEVAANMLVSVLFFYVAFWLV